MKIIAYIGAAILIFFGVLFIWSAFTPGSGGSGLIIGIVTVAIGFGLIFWASRRPAKAGDENVTLKIDMPGDVNMDTLKCKSCGGTLAPENITMVAGAPVVTCPYCHTTYQLTEEPKW
ncbi:MAG TPA: hypothetical protein VMC62_08780 [Longilinea sp.]|nr:hypothetical protein [Longilinea sp.]